MAPTGAVAAGRARGGDPAEARSGAHVLPPAARDEAGYRAPRPGAVAAAQAIAAFRRSDGGGWCCAAVVLAVSEAERRGGGARSGRR